MQLGALAMIDALGFKGIWKKFSHEQVIEKMQTMVTATDAILDNSVGGAELRAKLGQPIKIFESVNASFLSDTVILSTEVNPNRFENNTNVSGYALASLTITGRSVAAVIRAAASAPDPSLAFRGAMTFGKFTIDGRFCVGPAIDDAAECHELSEGAFVWITPTGLMQLGPLIPGVEFLSYAVPIRGGRTIETFVVNPFGGCSNEAECTNVAERILASFSSEAIGVVVKKQQTKRFLEYAHKQWSAQEK